MEDSLTSFNKEGLDPSAGLALHTVVFYFLKELKVVDLIKCSKFAHSHTMRPRTKTKADL